MWGPDNLTKKGHLSMLSFVGRVVGVVVILALSAIGLRTVALQIFIWKEGHDGMYTGTDVAA
jgi:hypothetical protein